MPAWVLKYHFWGLKCRLCRKRRENKRTKIKIPKKAVLYIILKDGPLEPAFGALRNLFLILGGQVRESLREIAKRSGLAALQNVPS